MGELKQFIMNNNTTNEGVVNNSNQPSQNNKLQELINNKISQLTEQLGKIGNEIKELKSIEVSDEVQKMVVGSTEFKIEDFMSEPDVQSYRNWLKLKKELEEKSEEEIDELIDDEKDEHWSDNFQDHIQNNYSWLDMEDLDRFYDWYDFVRDYIEDPDDYTLERMKDDYKSYLDDSEILEDYIKEQITN